MELRVERLSRVFSQNGSQHVVLRDVSFTVGGGEFVTLLGPSGCGKTTLLAIIAGFQKASGGEIRLNGAAVDGPGPERGFVFQDYALFPWLTVRENILFPLKRQGWQREPREERLRELLRMAHLERKEELYPAQLSGGMKQRTAVVRALASKPKVLLMDEPLGAVDPELRRKLQGELEELWLADRTTVLMVTHDVEEAVALSDRVLVMGAAEGRIVAELAVGLDRPRQRRHPAFHELRERLAALSGSGGAAAEDSR